MAQTVAPVVTGENPHLKIIRHLQSMGVRTANTSDVCESDPNIRGYWQRNGARFVVCFDNLEGDTEALFRTIRHEAIHVAQTCNAGPLWPQYASLNVQRAYDEGALLEAYPPHQHVTEAEARVMANELDAHEILDLIKEHCNH